MSTPIVITAEVVADIKRLVDYAQSHVMNVHDMWRCLKSGDAPGKHPEFCCYIPMGFKVVFTIEQQPDPLSWGRHFSISSPHPDLTPHPAAVNTLLPLFGFTGTVEEIAKSDKGWVWLEDIHHDGVLVKGKAINVFQTL